MTHFEVTHRKDLAGVNDVIRIEVNPIQVGLERRIDIVLEITEDEANDLCHRIFDATFELRNEAAMAKFSKEPR